MRHDRVISAQIEINASCELVWKVLTDFSCYCSWNPTITRIEGDLEVESCLRVSACLPCGLPLLLRPKLLSCKPRQEIKWLGSLIIPGLFDGEHDFILKPLTKGRTLFTQREKYDGVLVPLLWRWLGGQGQRAFELMNAALKERAELLQIHSLVD